MHTRQDMTTVQARLPESLKEEAEMVFSSVGLTTSDAIRVFFQQAVNRGGIPFTLRSKVPNAETNAAIEEAEAGMTEQVTLEDLRKEWGLPPT